MDGKIPADLDGGFYRTGPDAQFPLQQGNIPFDGEGHVSLFRFKDGVVHYKSRFVRNERYLAQEEAGRILFPMYRNPYLDDPSVAGKSRGTHNTHIIHHNGRLLALKEDSPPVYMDPLTLETLDDYYTFGGKLDSLTHTAHPKIDPVTGEYIGFGYEAKGLMSKDINVFSADAQGNINWSVNVQAPYAGMMHDFCVTQSHVILYLVNMVSDMDRMRAGGVHFSYDSKAPCYLGVLRRGGIRLRTRRWVDVFWRGLADATKIIQPRHE